MDDAPSTIAVARAFVPLRWAAPVVGLIALSGLALVAWSFSMSSDAVLPCFLSGMAAATVASFVAPRFAFDPPRIPLRRCTVTRAGILDRRGAPLLAIDRVLGVEIEVAPRGRILLRAFDRRLDAFELRFALEEEARAAERILCGARGRGVIAVRAQPWATGMEGLAAIGVVLGVLAATLAMWGPVVVPLAVLLVALMMAATPTRVVVGDDAVHVRWLARRVTFPIARITRASAGVTGATLDTRLGTRDVTRLFAMPPAAARRFVVRIGEALEAARAAAPSELESWLDRGGRAPETWVDDLRALGSDRRSYRAAAPPRGALIAVVEDVKRRAVDRAAAAIALAATDDAAREVVHAAARWTADPDLRRVLEHAARGERVDASILAVLAARDPSPRAV
jgi:hypothetical protein